jgi:amino acid permease
MSWRSLFGIAIFIIAAVLTAYLIAVTASLMRFAEDWGAWRGEAWTFLTIPAVALAIALLTHAGVRLLTPMRKR